MARNVYRYQCKVRKWEIQDARLSLPVLMIKWDKWTHASTHTPAQIIEGLKARIADLETELRYQGEHGPYNTD